MRDETVYGLLGQVEQKVKQMIDSLVQSIRLAFTGQEIRGASLQSLLLKKGVFTEAELTAEVGVTIQKMQTEAEEAAKKALAPTIVPATPDQVAQVTSETAVPVVPPQA